MNIEELREYCISKVFVEETFPFDQVTLVFKVMGKAFLLTSLGESPLRFNVKCDPELAMQLREEYSCVLPGYHMNKKHWNTIEADGSVPDKLLREWIDHSYEQVCLGLSKRVQEKLKKEQGKVAKKKK
ncbi:MAG TPA: MmcQ/YjbR family DNA-binding protein [Bacteroidia bacterium]|jgi:predicted DNA-binding protein (MmcQ/YjbR family)|nr:MmcQ/YjbR family DNA-binding protein [Bacteroidia bacterium]